MVNSMKTTCTMAAWCPADCTEALLQESVLHPYEGLIVGCDCFSDLWGPPDNVMLSKDQWQRFLQKASKWITMYLAVKFSKETKLPPGLFSGFQTIAKLVPHFLIDAGEANLDDVMTWVSRCRQAGVSLCIYNTCVLVTKGEVMKVMLEYWTPDSLIVEMPEYTPLAELLPHILDYSEQLAQCEKIIMKHGKAELNDLMRWELKCKQKGFELELQNTQLLVSGSSRGKNTSGQHSDCTAERPTLEVMLRERTKNRLALVLEEETPLVDVLLHLQDHCRHPSDYTRIDVKGGTTTLDDLMSCMSKYKELGLYLSIRETNVLVTEHIRAKIDIACQKKYSCYGRPMRTEGQSIHWTVTFENGILLTNVLPHILDHAEYLSQCEEIDVNGGRAELGDLVNWMSRCRQDGLKLKLRGSHLLLSQSGQSENKTGEERQSVTPRPALQVQLSEWSGDWSRLRIDLPEQTSPADLMLHLLEHAEYLSQFENIELYRGTAKLEVLATVLSQCKEAGLKVELHSTNLRSEQLRVLEDYPHDLETALTDEALSITEYPTKVRLRHWTPDELGIDLCKTGPLTGLLSWLLEHAVYLSKCRISVSGGAADISDVVESLLRSKQQGLTLTLHNTCVIVSSEWRTRTEMGHQPENSSTKEALEMRKIDTRDGLYFYIDESSISSPVGLLSHLTQCIDHLSPKDEINVFGGRADLPDLMNWVTRCHQTGLDLILSGLIIAGDFLKPVVNMTGQCTSHVKIIEWNKQCLQIKVDKSMPLPGLLSYIYKHATDMPLVKRIYVQFGTIELPDLMLWISNYQKSGLHLEFSDPHVVVPESLLAIEDTFFGVRDTSTTNHPVEATLKGYSMILALPETTPLRGLLSWLVDHAANMSRFPRVTMKNGTADLDDLMGLLIRCTEAGLHLELINVHIALSNRTKHHEHETCQPKDTDIHKGLLQLEPGKLRIVLDETSSLTRLQSCLLKNAAHLTRYNSISVGGGKADLGDLFTWVSQCRDVGLEVELDEVHSKTFIEDNVMEQCDLKSDTLSITVDRTTPLTDVVSYLLVKTAHLSQRRFIKVHSGRATLGDLLTWASKDNLNSPQFTFYDTNVIVAETDVERPVTLQLKELSYYTVRICMKDTRLSHLQPCLLDNAVQLSQRNSIAIENATAPLVELVACMSSCQQEGIYLNFSPIDILMQKQQATEVDKLHQSQNDRPMDRLKLKTVLNARCELALIFPVPSMCQVTDLLSQLPQCHGDLSMWELVKVEGGTAELGELYNCVTKCQQNGLKLELCEVVLSRTLNMELYEDVKAQRSELSVGEWHRECLDIWVLGQISLTDLLLHLYDRFGNLSPVKDMAVSGGTIELAEIVPWVCKYKKAGLKLTLPDTNIIVPEQMKSKNDKHSGASTRHGTTCPVVTREWVGGYLQIEVDETVSLSGLLSHFHQHAAELSSSVRKLVVANDLVDLADVMPWIAKLELAGIQLTWCDTQVVVHERLKAEADIAEQPEIPPAVHPLHQGLLMGWGTYQPETTPLKTAPRLNPVVTKCSSQVVSIHLLETSPLGDFLEWLRERANHLPHCRRISVEYGRTGLHDLMTQLSWYYLDGLKVEMLNSSVVVPDQNVPLHEAKILKFQKLEIVGDKVLIDLHETSSLTCLLSCLVDLAPRLSWYDGIDIRYGTADLGDLLTSISGCTQVGLRLELHDTCVLLPKVPTNYEDKHPQAGIITEGTESAPTQIGRTHSEWMLPYPLGNMFPLYDLESIPDEKTEPKTKIVWWVDDTLTLDLDWEVSVPDLLSVLLVQAVHLTHCQCICVLHGTAELDALMIQVYKCRQAGLKLELSNTRITGQDNRKYQTSFYFNRIQGLRGCCYEAKQGMDTKWTNDRLTLTLPTEAPLTDTLSSLLNRPVHLKQCTEIIVKYGTAELDDLMTCMSRYSEAGYRLRLYKPYVIVSDKPVDKDHGLKWQCIEDPGIRVMLDGWEAHPVLF